MAITTNRQYISATLEKFNVSENDVELILIKSGVNGDDVLNVTVCDNAIYNRLSVVLKAASQNVSEGGYSVSWNMEAVKLYYQALCQEIGKPNVIKPAIRNRSNYW